MQVARRMSTLVKLEHTLFALPFAFAGLVLGCAAADIPITAALVLWVTLAMIGARTLAMGLNRLIDAELDARNPRTASRELPSGLVTRRQVWLLCAASLALLVASTFALDPLTRVLWPVPVAAFVLYPYTKRLTWACHLVLGVTIGMAPLAAWLAVGASPAALPPYLLGAALAAWIAGFDVIYSTADVEFDRAEGLHSLPARFGVGPALLVVRLLHVLAVGLLVWLGVVAQLGVPYWIALVLAAALLAWENSIVGADDLSRIDVAFFTVNSWVGVVLGAGIIAGTLV